VNIKAGCQRSRATDCLERWTSSRDCRSLDADCLQLWRRQPSTHCAVDCRDPRRIPASIHQAIDQSINQSSSQFRLVIDHSHSPAEEKTLPTLQDG